MNDEPEEYKRYPVGEIIVCDHGKRTMITEHADIHLDDDTECY